MINCVAVMLLMGYFALSAVAAVESSPLQDARQGPRALSEAEIERIEKLVSGDLERELSSIQEELEKHLEKLLENKASLMAKVAEEREGAIELRDHIAEDQKSIMVDVEEIQKSITVDVEQIQANAMMQVEQALEDLKKQREQFDVEKERIRMERERVMDRERASEQGDSSLDPQGGKRVGRDGVYDLQDLDTRPQAKFQAKSKYPSGARKEGLEGWAVVEWIIAADGALMEIRVVDSTHEEFTKSAIEAVSKSKWEPGEIDGEAVSVRVRQRLDYKP